MTCHAPLTGWRTQSGGLIMGNTPPRGYKHFLQLPCSKCTGCIRAHAQTWAFRCQHELRDHTSAVFSTMTYRDETLPVTLQPRHLTLFHKRIRKAIGPIRFFASGEYGTQTGRAHYHAIYYGLNSRHTDLLEKLWGLGHVRTYDATPATVAYVASYTDKKLGDLRASKHERLDPETGEIYNWEPPFIRMSRSPGIGGLSAPPAPPRSSSATAEELNHVPDGTPNNDYKSFVLMGGYKIPVPRYLHERHWRQYATEQQITDLQDQQAARMNSTYRDTEQLAAQIHIDEAQHQQRKSRRQYP